jgi:hypothetical protein
MIKIDFSYLSPYINIAKKEGLLFSENCDYYGIFNSDLELMGFSAIKYVGKTKAIFKCEYVLSKFRGNSLLLKMIQYRINVLRQNNIKYVEAHCTIMSKNSHLKCGGKITKVFKNGITKIVYENI